MDARCDATPGGRGAARGAAQGHRLQEIRIRLPRRRDEPALRLGRGGHATASRNRAVRTRSRSCTTSPPPGPARGCRMSGSLTRRARSIRRSTCAGKGSSPSSPGIGGEAWVDGGRGRRPGAGHDDHGTMSSARAGLSRIMRRLGAGARDRATAAAFSCGPTIMSPGAADALPREPARPNCARVLTRSSGT